MPSTRRHACIAALALACAFPASASAASTGGVSVPSAPAAHPDPSIPTGGARPGPRPAPKSHRPSPKRAKAKAKKRRPRHHRAPRPPRPQPRPDASAGPGAADIPAEYLRLYRAAGQANGVSWRILAAIGKNESDHGRSTLPGISSGVNSARCCSGPMQMCTRPSCGNTWGHYAVDGDGDGVKSVYDPADAIFGAASLVAGLHAMFGDHPGLILAGYNAGPGNVQHYHGVPPFAETKGYVARGLAYMGTLAP
jgi:membrane-bound lytic murein transglycosylase B